MSDGQGSPPVVIVRPETNVTSGTAVQEKLISAAQAFADILKPTLGPRGLDKMLYKTDGTTAVTNDGAKIVAELMVRHPAAKAFVSLAESQENAEMAIIHKQESQKIRTEIGLPINEEE